MSQQIQPCSARVMSDVRHPVPGAQPAKTLDSVERVSASSASHGLSSRCRTSDIPCAASRDTPETADFRTPGNSWLPHPRKQLISAPPETAGFRGTQGADCTRLCSALRASASLSQPLRCWGPSARSRVINGGFAVERYGTMRTAIGFRGPPGAVPGRSWH